MRGVRRISRRVGIGEHGESFLATCKSLKARDVTVPVLGAELVEWFQRLSIDGKARLIEPLGHHLEFTRYQLFRPHPAKKVLSIQDLRIVN